MRRLLPALAVTATLGLTGGLAACSAEEADREGTSDSATPTSETNDSGPSNGGSDSDGDSGDSGDDGGSDSDSTDDPDAASEPAPDPISVPALDAARLPGGGLKIGAVRERTANFTSYDVSFRSTRSGEGTSRMRISGVLNVPTGSGPTRSGPFPAVVLAHGYIDPAYYERGQGMTRERGYLADRGFVTLHVDYRNHAESDDDPRVDSAVRLGYTTDVVAAARALGSFTSSDVEVAVDPDRIALFGRSMGGGVMLKALAIEPGLFASGVAWGSVSSLEAENFEHFIAPDADRAELRAQMQRRHGLPEDDPAFWRALSPRPYFDQITEPVLLVHGRSDSTCPPAWSRATQRALTRAGVDSQLQWYDDEHAFGPAFFPAMERTVRFIRASMR